MVITNVNQIVYQGDGVTTAFPFTLRIIDATDIKLLLLDSDGTETDILSDYFVDTENDTVHYPGYAPGAEPALSDRPPVLAEGQKLVIYRELPITQEKDLGDKWPFYVIELGLDKLTMILQQVFDWWGRTLRISQGEATSRPNFDLTVPIENGKTFRVKEDGTGFEATLDPNDARKGAELAQAKAEAAEADAENFAVSDNAFTKQTGDDHETQFYSSKHYAEAANEAADNAVATVREQLNAVLEHHSDGVMQFDHNFDIMPCQFPIGNDLWDVNADGSLTPVQNE